MSYHNVANMKPHFLPGYTGRRLSRMSTQWTIAAVIIVLAAGCEPDYVKDTNQFAECIKAVVKPEEVQEWATNLIAKYRYSNGITGIIVKEADVPNWVRMVYKDAGGPEQVSIQPGTIDRGNEPWVDIMYHPEIGRCGIEVGAPTFPTAPLPKPPLSQGTYRLQWKPGVYFWLNPRGGL